MNIICYLFLLLTGVPHNRGPERGAIADSVQAFIPAGWFLEFDTTVSMRYGGFHGHEVLLGQSDTEDHRNRVDVQRLLMLETLPDGKLQIVGVNDDIVEPDPMMDSSIAVSILGDTLDVYEDYTAGHVEYKFRFDRKQRQFVLIVFYFGTIDHITGDYIDCHANYLTRKARVERASMTSEKDNTTVRHPKIKQKRLLTLDETSLETTLHKLVPNW